MQTKIDGLEIFEGALDTASIYARWYAFGAEQNLGANAIFTGIVREENGCEGLSFDIYPPLLEIWFLKLLSSTEKSTLQIVQNPVQITSVPATNV